MKNVQKYARDEVQKDLSNRGGNTLRRKLCKGLIMVLLGGSLCPVCWTLTGIDQRPIGVAKILFGGCTFLAKKVDDLFLVVALYHLNIPPNLSHPAKTVLKISLKNWLGVHFVSCGGALTHFPCKLDLKKKIFTALGVQVHPLHPLATPMQRPMDGWVDHRRRVIQVMTLSVVIIKQI